MFNKRKQKRAQELSESRIEIEKQFHATIYKAGLMEDPAEKIIMLQAISDNISDKIQSESSAISKKAGRAAAGSLLGGGVIGVGGYATGLGMMINPVTAPVGACILGAGLVTIMVGGIGGTIHGRSVRNKFELSVADHKENLGRLQKLINVMTDITIEHNVKEISKSPLYAKVRALPGIAEKFADAAAKRLAAEEVPAVAETGPAAEAEQKTVLKRREPSNYKHLDGVIKPNKP